MPYFAVLEWPEWVRKADIVVGCGHIHCEMVSSARRRILIELLSPRPVSDA